MIINQQSLQYIAQYDVVCMFVAVVVVVVDFSLLRFWCLFSFLFSSIFSSCFSQLNVTLLFYWWLFISSTLVTLFHIESTIHTWTLNTLTCISHLLWLLCFILFLFFRWKFSFCFSLTHTHTICEIFFFAALIFFSLAIHIGTKSAIWLLLSFFLHIVISLQACFTVEKNFSILICTHIQITLIEGDNHFYRYSLVVCIASRNLYCWSIDCRCCWCCCCYCLVGAQFFSK